VSSTFKISNVSGQYYICKVLLNLTVSQAPLSHEVALKNWLQEILSALEQGRNKGEISHTVTHTYLRHEGKGLKEQTQQDGSNVSTQHSQLKYWHYRNNYFWYI
jgi:hypothetical protein